MSIVITGTGSDGNSYNLTPLQNAALRVMLDPAQTTTPNLWGNAFTFTRLPISPTQNVDYVTGGHTAINYSSRTQENRSRPAGWSNLPNFQNLMPNNRIMVNGATRQFLSMNNIRNYPATGRCFMDSGTNWRDLYVGDLMPRTFPFTGIGWNNVVFTVGTRVTDSRFLDVVTSQYEGSRQRTATLNAIWDSNMRAFNFLIVGAGGNGANQQSGTPKNSWTGGGGGGGGAWACVYVRVKRGSAGNRQIRMQAADNDAWIDYADGTNRIACIAVNRGAHGSGTSGGNGGGWTWIGSRTTGVGTRVFFEDDFVIIEALATGDGARGSNGAQDGNAAGQTSITTSIPWVVPIGLLSSNLVTGTGSSGTQLPGNQEQGQGGLSFFRSRMTQTPTIQGGSVFTTAPGSGGMGGGRITTSGRTGERAMVAIILN